MKDPFHEKNLYLLSRTLSHLKTILTAYKNGDKLALILEDDVCMSLLPFWDTNLKTIIKKIPKNWGIINLTTLSNKCIKNSFKVLPFKKTKCEGCLAYVINRKGMKDILNKFYKQFPKYGGFILKDKSKNIGTTSIIYNGTPTYMYNKSLFFPISISKSVLLKSQILKSRILKSN